MDEWQVGDPIGLGNDAGVPDIPYMGYLNNGDDDEDDVPYDDVVEPKSRDRILAEEAFSLQKQGRYPEALILIDRALDLNQNADNWNVKAIVVDNMGNHEEALEYYDKSIYLCDDDIVKGNKTQCLYRIACDRKFRGDYDGALEYINKALALFPDFERGHYLNFKGDILEHLGRHVQSRKCYLLASGMIDEIKELERKEDQIKNSDKSLINIAGTKFYRQSGPLKEGVVVDLIKEPDNEHDANAIRVELNGETVGYVGNGEMTVPEGIKSASQIKDEFADRTKAEVLFHYLDYYIIAKLI